MMKNCLLFLLVLAVFFHSFSQERIPVAVNSLEGKNLSQTDADIISERLIVELTRTSSFSVMERSQMNEILKEQGFQMSGACNDQSCIVQMGQMLGVQRIFTGNIGHIGQLYTLNLKMIDVTTGRIVSAHTEDYKGSIETMLSGMKSIALKFDNIVRQEHFGGLVINTEPAGAGVFLNGVNQGKTPWADSLLKPDVYSVEVKLASYKPIEKTISISAGKIITETFRLEYTRKYLDSLGPQLEEQKKTKALKKEKKQLASITETKKKSQWTRRIVFGGVSAVFLGVSMYMNSKVEQDVEEMNSIRNEYLRAEDQFQTYRDSYEETKKRAEKSVLLRTVSLGIAAFSAIGLGLSIPF